MGKRSLKASATGIAKAKQAFQRREWTQEYLASLVGLQTRQSVWKFFSGKPIERPLFVDLCFQLDLDWEEIAERPQWEDSTSSEAPPDPTPADVLTIGSGSGIDDWVCQGRSQIIERIQTQCSTLHTTLDSTHALTLDQIYTEVKLLPCLSNQRWLEITDLQEAGGKEERSPFCQSDQTSLSALEAVARYRRLVIVGKPGAGKTTFLQHLALLSSQGDHWSDRIPIFISLHEMTSTLGAEDSSLTQWISRGWDTSLFTPEQIATLMQEGHIWLLLDGLDEIPQSYQVQMQRQIQTLADTYPNLPVVMTCRLAAQDYYFRSFTYMEMADFAPFQITGFVKKWFAAMNPVNPDVGAEKAEQFLEQLQQRDNQSIQELAITPILLHLACLVFQERSAFPKKRSRLFQSGLDLLLGRWDRARGIHREDSACTLSIADRIAVLSQIAATFFEQGKYFFEKSEIIPIIIQYLRTLPQHQSDPEALWEEGEAILKGIAWQNGLLVERARDVYSFSHLTFQEYLTARRIFANTTVGDATDAPLLVHQLASHVTSPRWYEVIALTAELLPDPNPLFQGMKQHVDYMAADQDAVQTLLQWVERKTAQILDKVDVKEPLAAIRAFYLSLGQDHGMDLVLAIAPDLIFNLNDELALDLELSYALRLAQTLLQAPSLQQCFALVFALDLNQRFALDSEFSQCLDGLCEQMVLATLNQSTLEAWCQTEGEAWIQALRQALIDHRDIGHIWHLTRTHLEQLEQYYQATLFLVRCLKSTPHALNASYLELEHTLLLAPRHLAPRHRCLKPYPELLPSYQPILDSSTVVIGTYQSRLDI